MIVGYLTVWRQTQCTVPHIFDTASTFPIKSYLWEIDSAKKKYFWSEVLNVNNIQFISHMMNPGRSVNEPNKLHQENSLLIEPEVYNLFICFTHFE